MTYAQVFELLEFINISNTTVNLLLQKRIILQRFVISPVFMFGGLDYEHSDRNNHIGKSPAIP